MTTTVVHVNDPAGFDLYIGRASHRASNPRAHEHSPWANPFPVQADLPLSLRRFDNFLNTSQAPDAIWMRDHLHLIRGKRLACWCAKPGQTLTVADPYTCHGQILAFKADNAPPAPVLNDGGGSCIALRLGEQGDLLVDMIEAPALPAEARARARALGFDGVDRRPRSNHLEVPDATFAAMLDEIVSLRRARGEDLLSDDEVALLDAISDVSRRFRHLIDPSKNSAAAADWTEVAATIHVLQARVMARAAARAYPGKFRAL